MHSSEKFHRAGVALKDMERMLKALTTFVIEANAAIAELAKAMDRIELERGVQWT